MEPDRVEWHFASVSNRWTKRSLVASGFGGETRYDANNGDDKSAYEPLIGAAGGASSGSDSKTAQVTSKSKDVDIEAAGEVTPVPTTRGNGGKLVPIYGVNRPYFHVDIETAVASAISSLERRGSDWSGRE